MSVTYKKIKSAVKNQLLKDPMTFSLVLECEEIKGELDFEISYSVDPHTEEYDQKIASLSLGPIPKGNIGFNIETDPINFELLKPQHIFGLTSVIIVGKYKETPFLRVGYIFEVKYPGIDNKYLVKEDDLGEEIGSDENTLKPSNECECEGECQCEIEEIPECECEGECQCEVPECECEGDCQCNYEECQCEGECQCEVPECECEGDCQCNYVECQCEGECQCNYEECQCEGECQCNYEECDENCDCEEELENPEEIKSDHPTETKEEIKENLIKKVKLNSPYLPDPVTNTSVDSAVNESSFTEIRNKLDEPLIPVIFDENIPEENKIIVNGITLDKTKIEIEFKEPPLVTMFQIDWE